MKIDGVNLIFGLRRSDKSLKVYKLPDGKYIGIEKKYFLGFCYSRKKINYKNYSDAQDHIVYFRNEMII